MGASSSESIGSWSVCLSTVHTRPLSILHGDLINTPSSIGVDFGRKVDLSAPVTLETNKDIFPGGHLSIQVEDDFIVNKIENVSTSSCFLLLNFRRYPSASLLWWWIRGVKIRLP